MTGRRRTSPLAWLLIQPIRFYQRFITPYTPATCRYYPTCSSYAVGALRTHGAVKGIALTGWRLLRCNPWSSGGIDRVPTHGCWRAPVIEEPPADRPDLTPHLSAPLSSGTGTAEPRDRPGRSVTDLSCTAQPGPARAPIAGSTAA